MIATGALKRRLPTGGWAKGIPRNLSGPLGCVTPRNTPVLRLTSTLPAGAVRAQQAHKRAMKSLESRRGMAIEIFKGLETVREYTGVPIEFYVNFILGESQTLKVTLTPSGLVAIL